MEASSKASFKFIFIQHFVLLEQTRTRDCTKKGHFANNPSFPVKKHPETLQAFALSKALWVLEQKINLEESLMSREGSPMAHHGFGMAAADLTEVLKAPFIRCENLCYGL